MKHLPFLCSYVCWRIYSKRHLVSKFDELGAISYLIAYIYSSYPSILFLIQYSVLCIIVVILIFAHIYPLPPSLVSRETNVAGSVVSTVSAAKRQIWLIPSRETQMQQYFYYCLGQLVMHSFISAPATSGKQIFFRKKWTCVLLRSYVIDYYTLTDIADGMTIMRRSKCRLLLKLSLNKFLISLRVVIVYEVACGACQTRVVCIINIYQNWNYQNSGRQLIAFSRH